MSKNLDLKKGLDIPLKGAAALEVTKKVLPKIVAVKPDDFKGLLPRLLVREGDCVLAGSPVIQDKTHPDWLLTSPASGVVESIVRGEKRKLLAVLIKTDEVQEYVDFGTRRASDAQSLKKLLQESGLWCAIVQRPYGVIADTQLRPKSIFISSFSTAPLAPDTEFTLGDKFIDFQAGVDALNLLTDGGVHLCISKAVYSKSPFHKVENAILHSVSGPHPAGNVGVQISHISPILKGETVWTVSPLMVAAIGHLALSGKL